MKIKDVITWETVSGTPVTAQGATVTPESQLLRVQLPFGGFVWNRPSAVLVQWNGEQERIPIIDITRTTLIALIGATVLLWLVFARLSRKQHRDSSQ